MDSMHGMGMSGTDCVAIAVDSGAVEAVGAVGGLLFPPTVIISGWDCVRGREEER